MGSDRQNGPGRGITSSRLAPGLVAAGGAWALWGLAQPDFAQMPGRLLMAANAAVLLGVGVACLAGWIRRPAGLGPTAARVSARHEDRASAD